jgi:hypothetical protein
MNSNDKSSRSRVGLEDAQGGGATSIRSRQISSLIYPGLVRASSPW